MGLEKAGFFPLYVNELNKDALETYEKAVKLNPNNPQAYNNIGIALKILGKKNSALESYEKAIKLKPDYADAQLAYLLIHTRAIRLADAVRSEHKGPAEMPRPCP